VPALKSGKSQPESASNCRVANLPRCDGKISPALKALLWEYIRREICMKENVAILGASDNPERFAYKAFKMLSEYGHKPWPVNPTLKKVEAVPAVATLAELSEKIDTLTMYVNPKISAGMKDDIVALKPRRVIFNPGTENPELEAALEKAGIHTVEACTLVLLRTGGYETA